RHHPGPPRNVAPGWAGGAHHGRRSGGRLPREAPMNASGTGDQGRGTRGTRRETQDQGTRPDRRGEGTRRERRDAAVVPEAEFRSYYGRPIIKAPVWRYDIPAYLFTGGLAAGSA